MIIKGDVNSDGKISVLDSLLLRSAVLNRIQLTDEQIEAGDVLNDGDITAADFIRIRYHLLGRIMIMEVIE